jgi:hypothetical protein
MHVWEREEVELPGSARCVWQSEALPQDLEVRVEPYQQDVFAGECITAVNDAPITGRT